MGGSGRTAFKHGADCPCTSGEFPSGQGWEHFTDAIIQAVNAQDRPVVYMLWGRPAQSKIPMLTNPKHLILKAPHPSPLSAYRGFFGCKHFSQANAFLEEHGVAPIDWQIENL